MLVGRSNQIESLSMVYEQTRARRSVSGTKKNAIEQPRKKYYLPSLEQAGGSRRSGSLNRQGERVTFGWD